MFEAEYEEHAEPFRHIDYKGVSHHKGEGARAWNYKEFISFDGEGVAVDEPTTLPNGNVYWRDKKQTRGYIPEPQPYVLLGNSKKERITNEDGLPTVECFEFLLESKVRYPDSIFVGFGFNYDVNQMLRDLPEHKLRRLHKTNRTTYRKYWIKWHPRKLFLVKHRPTQRSMVIYDSFGFFQKSFLQTCKDYLGNDPRLELIQSGKDARDLFNWEELDEFIIPYNDTEMEMHVEIMNMLREDLHSVDAMPSQWHGPGAVASKVFALQKVPITRESPKEILDASQFAYAGGRFELLRMGRHSATVYAYDIHSAYPAAAIYLPDISQGYWEYVTTFDPVSFGLWNCNYRSITGDWHEDNQPKPLFCRSSNGSISYPNEVQGWYWTPEARLLDATAIKEGYIFRPDTDTRPFSFIEGMYDQRRILKAEGNSSQRALKLILNSIYGKLAQTIGADDEPPRWHQLEYAGYITSHCRAQVYEAAMQNPDAIISFETDAVFSTEPLDLPLSNNLGDWELTVYDEIIYLQNGFYYALQDGEIICKYRGMDKDRLTGMPVGLPYGRVLNELQRFYRSNVSSQTTRFNGLAYSLNTNATWRAWETKEHKTNLWPKRSKRNHFRDTCEVCNAGITLFYQLHPLEIGGHCGQSYARSLPWRTVNGPEFTEAGEDYTIWQ